MAKLAILILAAAAWAITSLIAFAAGLHQAVAVFVGLVPAVGITIPLFRLVDWDRNRGELRGPQPSRADAKPDPHEELTDKEKWQRETSIKALTQSLPMGAVMTAILWWLLYAGFNVSMPWWLIVFCVLLGAGGWQQIVDDEVFKKRMLEK